MNKGHICFESERLILEEITLEDSYLIVKWRSQEENIKYFLNPRKLTLEEHFRWFQDYLNNFQRIDLMIVEKSSHKAIGTVGIQNIDLENKKCSIAYMIGESWGRGRGYGIEAVKRMCQYAVEELGMHLIQAEVHKDNMNSKKLVAKLGFWQSEKTSNVTEDFLVYCKKIDKPK